MRVRFSKTDKEIVIYEDGFLFGIWYLNIEGAPGDELLWGCEVNVGNPFKLGLIRDGEEYCAGDVELIEDNDEPVAVVGNWIKVE